MKAIIENGGLDISLYVRYEAVLFKGSRVNSVKTRTLRDLLFFNKLLEVINLAVDEEDLMQSMDSAFRTRNIGCDASLDNFKYGFGTFPGNEDADKMDYMEVYQADNPNRIIYVELENI